MINLDERVTSLVKRGASRSDIMLALKDIAWDAEKRAARASKGGYQKGAAERASIERVGRILFFLHHGTPAQGASQADRCLYDLLKKLMSSDMPGSKT